MIDEMNREELTFVIHVGDITAGRGPCTDEWYEARRRQFERSRHPFVIVPGDNEWVDCHRSGPDPIERLAKFRELFEAGDSSLGETKIKLERQSGRYEKYREHMRWIAGNVLFVGLNVQGSNNNLGRTPAMDEEYRRRTDAVLAWLDEGMTLAIDRRLAGAVVFVQANPGFEGRYRRKPGAGDGFEEFRNALRQQTLRFGKPILFVHGDTHMYQQNRPLNDPSTGKPIANFVRVEVPGSPQVRWLKAGIGRSRSEVFSVSPAPPPTPQP